MCQTLRYRSRLGTSRATFEKSDDLARVHETIAGAISGIDASSMELSDKPSGPFQPFSALHGRTIDEAGMKHGDMLFLRFESADSRSETSGRQVDDTKSLEPSAHKLNGTLVPISQPARKSATASKTDDQWKHVKQHPVDDQLEKQTGKIPRPRDTKMCRHGLKGMCDYCMPLECKHSHIPSHRF